MREYIVEQMKQGRTLEDIHIAVEKMFNEEYNKRERIERERKIAAAFDRAAKAMTDYLRLVGDPDIEEETVRAAMAMAETVTFDEDEEEDEIPHGAFIKVKPDELDEEDKALFQFLLDMGLIKPVK